MANEYAVNASDLTAVADAIRAKGGTETALSFPDGFVSAVQAIEMGSGGSSEHTQTLISLLDGTIESIDLDGVTEIGSNAIRDKKKLTSVRFKDATSIQSAGIYNNTALKEIDMPSLTKMNGGNNFYNCVVENVVFPSLLVLGGSSFNTCKSLVKMDLPVCTSIESNALLNCSAFTTLILRSGTLCSLVNVNAFSGTPLASGGTGGTVYVPQALIETYQTATNWATLYEAGSVVFAAIEGSEYE